MAASSSKTDPYAGLGAPAFETQLSPEEESRFEAWKANNAPNDSGADYDFRGAFKAGVTPADNGHWPDTYKKPNHPTFSVESIYAKDAPGLAGRWDGETYIPAAKDPYAAIASPAEDPYSGIATGAEPDSTAVVDMTKRAARAALTGTGQAVKAVGSLAAEQDPEQRKEAVAQLKARGYSDEQIGALVEMPWDTIARAAKALAGKIVPDKARDNEIKSTIAEGAGAAVPALAATAVNPVAGVVTLAGQMGEAEREASLDAGDSPELAAEKAKIGRLGGAVMGAIPGGPVRPVAGVLERLATRTVTGAAINAAQDAAMQQAIDNQVDWKRVEFSALFGGGFGFMAALPEAVRVRAAQRIGAAQKEAGPAPLAAEEIDRMVAEELAKAPAEAQHATKTVLQQRIAEVVGQRETYGADPNAATPARQARMAEALDAGEVAPRAALDRPSAEPDAYARWWTEEAPEAAPAEAATPAADAEPAARPAEAVADLAPNTAAEAVAPADLPAAPPVATAEPTATTELPASAPEVAAPAPRVIDLPAGRKAAVDTLAKLAEELPDDVPAGTRPTLQVRFPEGGQLDLFASKQAVQAVARRLRAGPQVTDPTPAASRTKARGYENPTIDSAARDLERFQQENATIAPLEARRAELETARAQAAKQAAGAKPGSKAWKESARLNNEYAAAKRAVDQVQYTGSLRDVREAMGKSNASAAEVEAWLRARVRQTQQMGINDQTWYRGGLTEADVGQVERLRRGLARVAADSTNPRALGFVAPGFDILNEKMKKWAPSFYLPQAMRETLRLGDQATRAILSRGGALQKDLRMALLGIEDKTVRAQQTGLVQDYFTGKAPVTALDPSVRTPAQQVRGFIDGLSDRAVQEGVVSGGLADKFTDNLGKYLRRSYLIHADPDYAPTRKQITAAIDAVARQNKIAREEAAQLVNDLLDRNQRAAQVNFLAGRGKLAGKDVSSLVARKDLLPEIRSLLGEIEDPVANAGETIPRLGRLIEQHHAQVAMRDVGLKLGVFRDVAKQPLKDFEVGKWVPLVNEASSTHDVWAGLHTTPEIREALTHTASSGRVDGLRALTWRIWRGATGVAKTSKTVLNPDSYAPNLVGGLVSGAMNGNFRVDRLGRGLMLGAEETGALRWLQSKGLMPANRADLQEEIAKLTKLGLRGENLSAADLQQTLDHSVLRPLAEKTIKPLQHIYGGTDDLTKYIAWKSEMSRYARAFPSMGREELEQLAANIVRDTMPTYSQVPKVLREASQLGLAPTFVNYTYEVFRNTANTARIGARDLQAGLKTGNRGLVRAGAERLAAATAVLGLASGYGWSKYSRTNNGVSDDQDRAVRFFGPPWNKNGQLVYNSAVGPDGKVQFSNQSYLIPQALLFEAAGEASRAKDGEGMVNAFLTATGQQFLGIENSVVLDTILDASRGVDSDGRKILNPESPTLNQDRIEYIASKAFKPIMADKIKRMMMAYQGQLSETGRAYSLSEETMRLGGMRAQTLDAAQAARFKARGLADRMSDATALYRQKMKLNLPPEELRAAYDRSEDARKKVFGDLQDYYRYGRALNVPEDALIENLRKGGMNSSTILGVLDGVYVPGAKEQPETVGEIFARIRSLPGEQRQAALRAAVLKQPTILRALNERAQEEARGLSERDKLVRSLGVGDGERAGYIRARVDALPDVAAKRDYILRLARRGIITETIAAQLTKPSK